MRVTAQLINPLTSGQIWANRYEREMNNALTLQGEIVTAIATQLRLELQPQKVEQLKQAPPVNPDTYEAYLRGMYWLNKATPEGTVKGIAYLRAAVDRDPGDARAYAGLSMGYTTAAHGPEPPSDALSFARAAGEKAIQLDSTLDMAYAALGFIRGYYDWQWGEAQALMNKAIRLNPHLAIAHYHLAWYHVLFGRMEEAIAEHKRAQELDPMLPLHTAWLAEIYRRLGRFEEEIVECKKAIDIDPNTPIGHYNLARVYVDQRRFQEAFAEYEKAREGSPPFQFAIGVGYVRADRREEAIKILRELEGLPPNPWRAWWRATLNSVLGNKDEAFHWLNYEHPHAWVPWVRANDNFIPLRSDPRLAVLTKRMNLPPPED